PVRSRSGPGPTSCGTNQDALPSWPRQRCPGYPWNAPVGEWSGRAAVPDRVRPRDLRRRRPRGVRFRCSPLQVGIPTRAGRCPTLVLHLASCTRTTPERCPRYTVEGDCSQRFWGQRHTPEILLWGIHKRLGVNFVSLLIQLFSSHRARWMSCLSSLLPAKAPRLLVSSLHGSNCPVFPR